MISRRQEDILRILAQAPRFQWFDIGDIGAAVGMLPRPTSCGDRSARSRSINPMHTIFFTNVVALDPAIPFLYRFPHELRDTGVHAYLSNESRPARRRPTAAPAS